MGAWERLKSALRIERDSRLPGGGSDEFDAGVLATSGYEGGGMGDANPWYPHSRKWAAIPAAYAAVALLSQSMARLPAVAGRVNPEGMWEPDPDHYISVLLRYPSQAFDPWQFWEGMYRALFAGGNAFAWIRRDGRQPVELIPCIELSSEFDGYSGAVKRNVQLYRKQELAEQKWVAGDDLVSLHGPDFDGLHASSPVTTAAMHVIDTMHLVGKHNRNSLRKGFHSRGLVEMSPDLVNSAMAEREARKDFVEEFTGVTNAGKTPFLPPGMMWKEAGGFSSVDLQLIELLKFNVEDIARVFNVPPRLLQHFHEGARVSQVFESQSEDFTRYSIGPHAERIAHQLTKKLLTPEEVLADMEIRLDTEMLRHGTFAERAVSAEMLVTRGGILTINEGRRMLGYPPHKDGDKLLEPKGAPEQGGGKPGEGGGKDKDNKKSNK